MQIKCVSIYIRKALFSDSLNVILRNAFSEHFFYWTHSFSEILNIFLLFILLPSVIQSFSIQFAFSTTDKVLCNKFIFNVNSKVLCSQKCCFVVFHSPCFSLSYQYVCLQLRHIDKFIMLFFILCSTIYWILWPKI